MFLEAIWNPMNTVEPDTPDGVVQVRFDGALYREALALRERHLRHELGLELTPDDVEGEEAQIHLVHVIHGKLVGCVILKPVDDQTIRLRQMVVASSLRGRGIGAMLIHAAEQECRRLGAGKIVLHARSEAMGFYSKLGFKPVSGIFMEVGIPHQTMEKLL